jgi:hypothetical protein
MRRIGRILALSVALLVLGGGTNAVFSGATGRGAGGVHRKHKEKKARQPATVGVRIVCANQAPPGWIRTGDRWDPTNCGNPTSIVYNVWTIEKYRGRPEGSVMRVCAGPVPGGWALVDAAWDPNDCGHPMTMIKNVMTIRKLGGR